MWDSWKCQTWNTITWDFVGFHVRSIYIWWLFFNKWLKYFVYFFLAKSQNLTPKAMHWCNVFPYIYTSEWHTYNLNHSLTFLACYNLQDHRKTKIVPWLQYTAVNNAHGGNCSYKHYWLENTFTYLYCLNNKQKHIAELYLCFQWQNKIGEIHPRPPFCDSI